MRNRVIDTIINLWESQRADEFTRYLDNWSLEQHEIFNKFEFSYEGMPSGTPGELYKVLILLTGQLHLG